ncbi:MAG TPA: hypothetical protein VD816_08815, partial [Ohtaekwangia sp.]|nr:hypothetical protein [Ohtaekwangia sp.]
MKSISILLATVIMLASLSSFGQDNESEVPGDNFSLEGALELFKKSESPEDFERLLNSPDSKVNNLDLNGDGYIDYIRVLDRSEKNVHVFILQAVISEQEYQDVAVIELEKQANGKAVLQIVGNEDIYGIETIIEPTREVRTYAGTMSDPEVVNVWTWPSVQYVYSPSYTVWYSPWGWHSRPVWWRPWRPVTYVHYHSIWHPYRPYYAVCHTRRVVHAHHIYHPHRTTSVIVHNRHRDQLTRYRQVHHDDYRRSRSDERRAEMNNGRSQQRDSRDRNSRSSTRDTQTRSQIRETIDSDSRSRSQENEEARQRRITGETTPVKSGDNSSRLKKDNNAV